MGNIMIHQLYLKRTLSEWEAYCLQEMFEICHQIMYSGFNSPQELSDRIEELANSIKTDSELPALNTPVAHR
ncbi:MAG TPA: hypothetical protein V6C95_12505 [Coleofasciculaceae cyanobacterium]